MVLAVKNCMLTPRLKIFHKLWQDGLYDKVNTLRQAHEMITENELTLFISFHYFYLFLGNSVDLISSYPPSYSTPNISRTPHHMHVTVQT